MKNKIVSALTPHFLAIIAFIVISSVYFTPVFEGKSLEQSDVQGYLGMSKEIRDFREKTHEEPLWTNSMFSGMPAYLISMRQPGQLLSYLNGLLTSYPTRPVCFIFLYMLGFYILLQLFGLNTWLSFAGGIAYGFSSYLFIILEPGHITKAMALGYLPMIIGAVYYAYKKNALPGAALTSLFLGLQLLANHLQITYYTLIILLFFGAFEAVRCIKEKMIRKFLKTTGLLIVAAFLAIGMNSTALWTVLEYSKYSMRGPSELTHNAEDKTQGLDRSYATAWSYSKEETFNLLIPNFKGGSSGKIFGVDSNIFKYLSSKYGSQSAVSAFNQNPGIFTQYWGEQPGTAGPVYIGASLIFIFVLGLFLLRGPLKWWLFSITVFAILLSWGRHFMFLTNLFLDYFPLYNKFRTVSMILIIAEFAIPLFSIYTIYQLINEKFNPKEFKKAIAYALGIVGGICLIFALAPGLSDLTGQVDDMLKTQGYGDWIPYLRDDRADLLRKDAFRSLIIVLVTSGIVFLLWSKKLNLKTFYILLPLILLIDLWPVNKRYLNDDQFVPKRNMENPFIANEADKVILKDKELYFRVFDRTPGDPFSSTRAAYFHKSIGGYHGAKIRRYQDLIERYISGGNENVLDMLNTKYLIISNQQTGNPIPVTRSTMLGNAWFVPSYKVVENANEEIAALEDLDPKNMLIVDKSFENNLAGRQFNTDSSNFIRLKTYAPNRLKYDYQASTDQLTVFSEVYYPEGWKLYIDGKETPCFRANYILRAAVIPSGKHEAEFVFRPKSYFTAGKISLASSIILILVLGGALYYTITKSTALNIE